MSWAFRDPRRSTQTHWKLGIGQKTNASPTVETMGFPGLIYLGLPLNLEAETAGYNFYTQQLRSALRIEGQYPIHKRLAVVYRVECPQQKETLESIYSLTSVSLEMLFLLPE